MFCKNAFVLVSSAAMFPNLQPLFIEVYHKLIGFADAELQVIVKVYID